MFQFPLTCYFNKTTINQHSGSPTLSEPRPDSHQLQAIIVEEIVKKIPIDQFLQEVCITLRPTYHNKSSTDVYKLVEGYLTRYHRRYQHTGIKFVFTPEFNKQGILHFHGIVSFNEYTSNNVAEFKRKLNIKFGRTEGKQVQNIAKYIEYITKDTDSMNHAPIIKIAEQ